MLDKILSRSLSICSSEVAELEHHSGQSATKICKYVLRLVVPLHWRVGEISISKNQVLLDHMEPELLQPHSAHRCEVHGREHWSRAWLVWKRRKALIATIAGEPWTGR